MISMFDYVEFWISQSHAMQFIFHIHQNSQHSSQVDMFIIFSRLRLLCFGYLHSNECINQPIPFYAYANIWHWCSVCCWLNSMEYTNGRNGTKKKYTTEPITTTNKHYLCIDVRYVNETNTKWNNPKKTVTHKKEPNEKYMLFVYRTQIAFGMKIKIMSRNDRQKKKSSSIILF